MIRHPVVLVIEDQTELRQVIRDVFDDQGFDVIPVSAPSEALAVLRDRSVHLLVSDYSPAEGQSDQSLAELEGEFPELPVIVLSEEDPQSVPFFGPWRMEGTRITLRKPFKLDDLIAASREFVG